MKKLLLLFFLVSLFSCKKTVCPDSEQIVVYDTIYIPVENEIIVPDRHLLTSKIDSLEHINSRLSQELLHKSLIIENAKYYLDICNRNPSQDKFLKGWMNRALNQ